jgi:Ca-activated chloride channel homolog
MNYSRAQVLVNAYQDLKQTETRLSSKLCEPDGPPFAKFIHRQLSSALEAALRRSFAKIPTFILMSLAAWVGTLGVAAAPQKQQDQAGVRVSSDLVTLSVTVRNRAGNLVDDLRREQFRLLDDGVEQSITVFAEEKVALSLVILIDNDLNGKEGVQMVQSLRALLGSVSLEDQSMVCRFDMLFYPGDNFTSDLDELMTAVKEAQDQIKPTPKYIPQRVVCGNSTTGPPCIAAPSYAGARPSKALDDAVFSAAELLQGEGTNHRKVILVISDGANEPKLNKHDYESVKEKLLAENISVFSLVAGRDSDKHKFSRLEQYSRVSGGDIYFASKSRAMEQSYSRITEQARHQYTLAYVPAGNNFGSNYHRIELQVEAEGLSVHTREGYYNNRAAVPKK